MDYLSSILQTMLTQREGGRKFLVFFVYLATLLDNILLTVIVPILPDYLSQIDDNSSLSSSDQLLRENVNYKNLYLQYFSKMFDPRNGQVNLSLPSDFDFTAKSDGKHWNDNKLSEENGAVGVLLATKALIQMLSTPFVKNLTNSFGYRIPTVFGTFILFLASSAFAIGKTYFWLLFARAMHGFASACISICGMSLIAQIYPEEKTRSQVIGIVLGSMALGVLLGYPFGGILYALNGKSAPFFVISILTFLILALQLLHMDLECKIVSEESTVKSSTNYMQYLGDSIIVKIAAAIFLSTISIATMEPCLPIWLITTLKPEKWQVGMVFIPDSIGYFVSTNFFAILAHRAGRMQIAVIALTVVGFSCLLIPHANSILSLVLPHFALGIGIGTLDVALVPLLASIVDSKYMYDDDTTSVTSNGSSYGGIYAIQQISVSMAYFLGPLLGGELAQYIGFLSLMSFIGVLNLCYAIYLMITVVHIFQPKDYMDGSSTESHPFSLRLWPNSSSVSISSNYKRFYDSVDER